MSPLGILLAWLGANVLLIAVLAAVAVRELRYTRRHEAGRERHYARCDAYASADEREAARLLGYETRPEHPWSRRPRSTVKPSTRPEGPIPEGACREQTTLSNGNITG